MTVIRHIEIKNVYKIVSHGQKINIGIGGFYDNQCLSVCLLPDQCIYILGQYALSSPLVGWSGR